MPLFSALPRKLALLPLSFFMVGWGVYVAGFIALLNSWTTEEGALFQHMYQDYQLSKSDPILSPFYYTLVGGPFVALFGILHAALPGQASSIFGTLSAVLSVIHFASVGAATFICATIVYKVSHIDAHQIHQTNIAKMLVGMLSGGLCWCFVLILSTLYKYQPEEQRNNHPRRAHCPFMPGIARLIAIPCLVLAVVGWCVFSAGLYKYDNAQYDPYGYCYSCYPPFYTSTTFIITPLLYLAALLHAGGDSNTMGIFTSVLGMVYLFFMGNSVNNAAIALHHCNNDYNSHNRYSSCTTDHMITLGLILGGGLFNLFFWGCTIALWPFYRKHPPADSGGNWPTAHQRYTSEPPLVYGTMQQHLETQPLIGRNMSVNM